MRDLKKEEKKEGAVEKEKEREKEREKEKKKKRPIQLIFFFSGSDGSMPEVTLFLFFSSRAGHS